MSFLIKAAAVALTVSLIGVLLRQKSPELSALLSMTAVIMIGIGAVSLTWEWKSFAQTVRTMLGTDETLIAPVFKCVGIAMVTKLSGELCREASHGAIAAVLELTGTVCAIGVGLPLVTGMLRIIGGMV